MDKTNILIVDDLPEKLLVLHSILEELEQNVVAARSGQEALRQVMEREFAVILLDVNMPDMDGYETAALIRKRKKSAHVPIIFITAYADEVHTAHGYTLGAVDFILSPVVPEILRTKVKVFVDLFRMTQQIIRQADEQVALAQEQAARSAAEEMVVRLNFLAEASKLLAGSLDLAATLRALLGLVVTRKGDLGIITLRNDQGLLGQTELAWIDPKEGFRTQSLMGLDLFHASFASALQHAVESETPEHIATLHSVQPITQLWSDPTENCKPSLPDIASKSIAIVPLRARGRALGALSLIADRTGPHGEAADLALLEDLAIRAAIAIDNARLYGDIQEADRRKNEFLSMLAHELRNPLAPLLNGIDVLRLLGPTQPEAQKIQDMMDRQVHHLIRLVDDLLDISRITRDKIQLQMEPLEVAVVVERAVEVSRPLIDARKQRLMVTLPSTSVRIKADLVRLAQVLSNLLNNAAKYTQEGGAISLVVEPQGTHVIFRIRDNGMGIPAEMLGCIFELFTQVKRSLDRSQGGLGVGLTLVRRLVEMHGGAVQAFSAGPNMGSEFVVRLPAVLGAANQEHARNRDVPKVNNSRRRVLVVDDNFDVADGTASLLQQIGSEVQVAHDGPAALAAAVAFRPEIVLLDIGMPGMDGYEVARRMRAQTGLGNPLLVALSGYGQEEDRQRSVLAGFDVHLVKPASLPDLRAILAESRTD